MKPILTLTFMWALIGGTFYMPSLIHDDNTEHRDGLEECLQHTEELRHMNEVLRRKIGQLRPHP